MRATPGRSQGSNQLWAGDCSSCAFLIHKWVEISRVFQTITTRERVPGACVRAILTHKTMEMNERMSKRLGLLGAMVGLMLMGILLACGSNYNASQDGLLLVGSQGSSVIETFTFTLSNGHTSSIANSPNDTGNQTCLLNGSPSYMVANPAGTYLFVIFKSNQCPNTTKSPGIATFQILSDGNVKQVGGLLADPNPTSLAMDSAGKFLFVAEGANVSAPCFGVCAYAIGGGGSLTAVKGTFNFVNGPGFGAPNIVAVAASPTVFPGIGLNGTVNSVCSVFGSKPPTSEYLYAVDAVNDVVWEYAVDTSSGALGNPPKAASVAHFATDQVPLGVAVDPCDRFVYVSDSQTNKISGYTICIEASSTGTCPNADGSLVPISGSPFVMSGSASGPGPIAVSPYGNNLYVVGTLSNTLSGFTISPVSGSLAASNPATVATGTGPIAMAIRADNNWLFVSNFGNGVQGGSTVSQYSITPATGALSVLPTIQTDNYPFGVAVK
jgi:6-phosphogluconolactonase (cycloisomerase 2 family)